MKTMPNNIVLFEIVEAVRMRCLSVPEDAFSFLFSQSFIDVHSSIYSVDGMKPDNGNVRAEVAATCDR
ncbi:MAG: hypothetical protein H6R01_1299 [Burkholderiaceae bacterium]|nr:hypothetical protein [Burkholderiaceae bacterium]